MKDRGSALLTTVIAIMVLILISGVIFTIALSYTKVETSEEKGIIAYHMAEAGIQYGIAQVLDEDLGKDDDLPDLTPLNDPFGQGGQITVDLVKSEEGDSFIVTSIATYNGVIRKKVAEYLYEADEQNPELNPDPDPNPEPNDCLVNDPIPSYPAWDSRKDYSTESYVTYNGKAFYNRYYASAGMTPGFLNNPWQEITKQWRNFNVYVTGDEVCYNGKKFKARYHTQNQQPGIVNNPWQELTDEWRNFNVYKSGDIVVYNGHRYRAKEYSENNIPGLPNSPWELIE